MWVLPPPKHQTWDPAGAKQTWEFAKMKIEKKPGTSSKTAEC